MDREIYVYKDEQIDRMIIESVPDGSRTNLMGPHVPAWLYEVPSLQNFTGFPINFGNNNA